MQNFVELLKDHALILSAARSLSAITRKSEADAQTAFAALRQLTRLLDHHLRAESEFIDANHQIGDGDFEAMAEQRGERFDDLIEAWGSYLHRWSVENIRTDWPIFVEATETIIGQLNEQIEAENQSLYPAAQRYGLIRLLPSVQRVPAN